MTDHEHSLYPTDNKIAARQAKGTLLSTVGIKEAATSKSSPWMIDDRRVLAPA